MLQISSFWRHVSGCHQVTPSPFVCKYIPVTLFKEWKIYCLCLYLYVAVCVFVSTVTITNKKFSKHSGYFLFGFIIKLRIVKKGILNILGLNFSLPIWWSIIGRVWNHIGYKWGYTNIVSITIYFMSIISAKLCQIGQKSWKYIGPQSCLMGHSLPKF